MPRSARRAAYSVYYVDSFDLPRRACCVRRMPGSNSTPARRRLPSGFRDSAVATSRWSTLRTPTPRAGRRAAGSGARRRRLWPHLPAGWRRQSLPRRESRGGAPAGVDGARHAVESPRQSGGAVCRHHGRRACGRCCGARQLPRRAGSLDARRPPPGRLRRVRLRHRRPAGAARLPRLRLERVADGAALCHIRRRGDLRLPEPWRPRREQDSGADGVDARRSLLFRCGLRRRRRRRRGGDGDRSSAGALAGGARRCRRQDPGLRVARRRVGRSGALCRRQPRRRHELRRRKRPARSRH